MGSDARTEKRDAAKGIAYAVFPDVQSRTRNGAVMAEGGERGKLKAINQLCQQNVVP